MSKVEIQSYVKDLKGKVENVMHHLNKNDKQNMMTMYGSTQLDKNTMAQTQTLGTISQ